MCRKLKTLKRTSEKWRKRALSAEAMEDLYLKGMGHVTIAWQKAHGCPKSVPSIKELVEWLMRKG